MNANVHLGTGAAHVAADTQSINNLPEWLRVPAACQRFGVSRSWLYKRMKAGQVIGKSPRQRGALRGIRLVSRDSLAAFIEGADACFKEEPGERKEAPQETPEPEAANIPMQTAGSVVVVEGGHK